MLQEVSLVEKIHEDLVQEMHFFEAYQVLERTPRDSMSLFDYGQWLIYKATANALLFDQWKDDKNAYVRFHAHVKYAGQVLSRVSKDAKNDPCLWIFIPDHMVLHIKNIL